MVDHNNPFFRCQDMFDWFAMVFSYPNEFTSGQLKNPPFSMELSDELKQEIATAATVGANHSLATLEDQFTYGFDLNPDASLDLGWHVYGEDYKRGALLVRLRNLLHESGITESGELPDHLTHCLLLISRIESEEAERLHQMILIPALEKILKGLSAESCYFELLKCLPDLLNECANHEEIPA